MIKLYGFKISNYQAMIKCFLLEKGVAFEELEIRPSKEESFLAMSPMGKVPFIELKEGFLSESTAILGFLENCTADEPMVPAIRLELPRWLRWSICLSSILALRRRV